LRSRFWLEAGLAITGGFLAVLTLVWPDWIEAIFGVDPDRHSGAAEWLVAGGLLLAAATSSALAALEWNRSTEPST
jgi:hypothetical protein